MISRHIPSVSDNLAPLLSQIQALVRPVKTAADLEPIIDRVGNARYVLLGEASHGTAEYGLWRHRLTARLVREKGFSLVALLGDWSDVYRLNRFVRLLPNSGEDPLETVRPFAAWPAWKLGNRSIASLVEWLRAHNDPVAAQQRVGLYGLDVYGFWNSMHAVLEHLDHVDAAAAATVRLALEGFEPYQEDLNEYARTMVGVPESRATEVIAMLGKRRQEWPRYDADGTEGSFHAEQNTLAAANAEAYYRTLLAGGTESWNLRARHLVDTLERLMHHHGPTSKVVVWAHNTHAGDARFTDMAGVGMVSLGQLLRQAHSEQDVVLVGCGSYRGKVLASPSWGEPAQIMELPPAAEGSWDDILHRVSPPDKLLVVGPAAQTPEFLAERGQRAVGVVYHPQAERYGNYIPTVLPRRYDAFLYFDQTQSLRPLAPPVPPRPEPWAPPVGT
jgi:erythromycin esterase-like protein